MHEKDAKSLLSAQNGFNLYRGCTHGCIYCDSRSVCYGMEHPFEDVEVKRNAPELLEAALRAKRRPCMLGTGSMCDPYLPLERELRLTRRCLALIERYGFGISVLTKSDLVLRDTELLRSINEKAKAVVQMTLTTFDEELCAVLEPHVCGTRRRFETLLEMKRAGIPTVVWLSPFLPYLNDTQENLRGLLGFCAEAGVKGVVFYGVGVTLRAGDREYFYAALDRHFPGLKERYIRQYGNSYEVQSPRDRELSTMVYDFCAEHGILCGMKPVFRYLREFPERQLSLFSGV